MTNTIKSKLITNAETVLRIVFRVVFWDILPCKMIVDRRFLMMEAVRTSETSVDNHFTRQYNPEDSSEHNTRRRENLKSHSVQGKGQAVPQHAHGVVGGGRMYSSYSFMTSALDGGEWSASRPDRALPQGKVRRYPLYRRLGGSQSRSGHRG
jgi:hypothetical protein